ncbi:MAG: spermidine synthase [Acidimicrobiales bacterium]
MGRAFEELDRRPTPMGEISLRRRLEPTLQVDVYEAMLGDEHLMSSLFTVAEIALARLALPEVAGTDLDVVVGGLGLGYTARAALDDPRVRSVQVIEALDDVIGWHERHLLPLSSGLMGDERCRLVQGDFFAIVGGGLPFGAPSPERVHAVLVDIDHTPRHLLHPSHAPFYTEAGLARLTERLHPGGVFALWSDAPPDDPFLATLRQVFTTAEAHVVPFPNHHTGGEATNTIYVAR